MSNVSVICPFLDCPFHKKSEYTDIDFFKRHLALAHDRDALYQLAFDNGIIEDPIRYQSASFVIQQVANFSIVESD